MCMIVAGAGGANPDAVRALGAEPGPLDLLHPRAVRPGGHRRTARGARRVGAPVRIDDAPLDPTMPPGVPESDPAVR